MRSSPPLVFAAALLAAFAAAAEGPSVVVAQATLLEFPFTVEGLGTAHANESVEIRPQLTETLTAIRFEEGQRVEKGSVLAELENSQALSAVAVARAELVDADAQLGRAKRLIETQAVSSAELEQRQARRDAASARLDAAEARLRDTVIRAPFAGRLGLRRVSAGSLVSPTTVITTLDDSDPIKLDFDVPEAALARLEAGLPVVARSVAWPEIDFEGHVASIDTRVDPISRSIKLRALVPNPDGRLRPGMLLSVNLLRENVSALMIPEQAIVPEQSRQFVFVVGEGELAEKRQVRTGRRRPGEVEVLEGLVRGERVIAEGTQKARPGKPVEVVGHIELTSGTAQ